MNEDVGSIEYVLPMRDALHIDEVDHGTAYQTVNHVGRTAADDETEQQGLQPMRGFAAYEGDAAYADQDGGQGGEQIAVTLQHAEGAAHVAHVGEIEKRREHLRFAYGKMGIDEVAAQLRQRQHQQSREGEDQGFAVLRHDGHAETKAAFYRTGGLRYHLPAPYASYTSSLQGNALNLLFICSRNQWRSPTAEHVWRRHPGVAVRSAGTSAAARRVVSAQDIAWADIVFAMEQKHKSRLAAEFGRLLEHKRVVVLDIPDDYKAMDPELIELLRDAVAPILEAEMDGG